MRCRGQIGGHRQGGAPVVGERRGGHAGVADGHQFGHPGSGLLGQEVERLERPLAGIPLGVLFPRQHRPSGLPARRPLLLARMFHRLDHGMLLGLDWLERGARRPTTETRAREAKAKCPCAAEPPARWLCDRSPIHQWSHQPGPNA